MDGEEFIVQKIERFKNGDVYEGGWKNGQPEGTGRPEGYGKYVWTDGSTYEGHWKGGLKHGKGTYTWPSGNEYTGEWIEGVMQGHGIFKSSCGTRYEGGFVHGLKHGLGKKFYANGDKYDGIWKMGRPDGPGRYVWVDGNEYNGEWKAGRMHGHGTFQWKSSERYDGDWKDGQQHGLGTFQGKNGSQYDGLWENGKKNGVGFFRPAHFEIRGVSVAPLPSVNSESSGIAQEGTGQDDLSDGPLTPPPMRQGDGCQLTEAMKMQIFLREYHLGRKVFEVPINLESSSIKELLFAMLRHEEPGKLKRLLLKGGEKDKGPGETIYKEHRSYDIMLNLQMGIQYSVGRFNMVRLCDGLEEHHFSEKVNITFPSRGSNQTPPHMSADFKWKDYAPIVFRRLRESFGIDPADYLMSLCGNEALRELPSPGKSGSMFYLSHDNKFVIKTMKKAEIKHLLLMLKKYYTHMDAQQNSLITKFYGLHAMTPYKGKKIRFVVMGNLFRTDLPLHRRYDLKGSTYGRLAQSSSDKLSTVTLKDLDLTYNFKVEEGWHERLHHQLKQDCKLLKAMKVMDYSLLLGVHFRGMGLEDLSPSFKEVGADKGMERQLEQFRHQIFRMDLDERHSAELLDLVEMKIKSHQIRKNAPQQVLTKQPRHNDSLRPVACSDSGTDALAFYLDYDHVQLGKNMAATALKQDENGNVTDSPEDVILYFGIIDILQEYNLQKRLENKLKSILHDGRAISAVDPDTYAERFLSFMRRVFQ